MFVKKRIYLLKVNRKFQGMEMRRFFWFFIFIYTTSIAQTVITDYQRTYIPIYTKNGDFSIAIRVFQRNATPSFLIVNTKTLVTSVEPVANVRLKSEKSNTSGFTEWKIESTPYYQLVNRYTSEPYFLENDGITHAKDGVDGVILTIDLCPSTKPFEKQFFENLAALATTKPTPVAISVSGMWILMHQDEFQYLLSLQKTKKLDITWVNHSFSHPYFTDLPYSKNFLLANWINEKSEILLTEQNLLQEDQIPSVFFRFPGLISSEKLIKRLRKHGLIPLGSDTWIAKNQPIHKGSIILVHGNGNEPEGIQELTPKLKDYHFLSLNSGIT